MANQFMAKTKKIKPSEITQTPQTLGEYAYQIIATQYQHIVKQEKKVLADKDPEPLHQMRVGIRRLRTALQIFSPAIALPKAANAKSLRKLGKILGEVRDLDVQSASVQQEYRPSLSKREQKHLDKVAEALKEHRSKAFNRMEAALTHSHYQNLKAAYDEWLIHPTYQPIAQFALSAALPDLISPLLSELLLHPGWLVSFEQAFGESSVTLHELRKACKHARYQAEFFTPFYGDSFQTWIKEVKTLQDQLGEFQDTQVFLDLLSQKLGEKMHLPNLQAIVHQKQVQALSDWETTRQRYQDRDFRYDLHQMLLHPDTKLSQLSPEPSKSEGSPDQAIQDQATQDQEADRSE